MKIAILGAECTGKTALAQALCVHLQAEHPSVMWVPEYLREWCEAHGRTPHADEQAHIAQIQMDRVNAYAHEPATLVLSDTTPLMTAIYSEVLLGDRSLYALAVKQQSAFGLTLVTAPDLPWVADGLQRDSVTVRARVNQRLREVLVQYGIGYSMVYGAGETRTQSALQVIRYALGAPRPAAARSSWTWACDKCSDPDCEHRLFSALLDKR
jgi:HTH-type transcriptional regulator, transcriptional repressor of NAD biosynthesis genes